MLLCSNCIELKSCIIFGGNELLMVEDEPEKITSDFQCFVCGAVFTTDQDRRQHLEKEMHGEAHDDIKKEDIETAKKQTELSESYRQGYESSVV